MVLPEAADMQQFIEVNCLMLDVWTIDILLERIYCADVVAGSTTGLGHCDIERHRREALIKQDI